MTEPQPHVGAAVSTPSSQEAIMHMLMGMWRAQAVAQLVDLNMLVMTGGLERTAREYDALFSQAGFRLHRLIPIGSHHVLEAVVV